MAEQSNEEQQILLPKSIRSIKGAIWRWFTWGDLFVIFPVVLLFLLPLFVGVNINVITSLIPYIVFDVFLLIITFLLIYPFFPLGKKGRTYIWNMFNHLIGKKVYSNDEVKNLAVPFDSISDDGVLKGKKIFTRVIKIKGVDISIFSNESQNAAVSGFGRIFNMHDSSITINKFNRRKDYSKWVDDLTASLNDEIKIFMLENKDSIKNFKEMHRKAEDPDGDKGWGDFFQIHKASFSGLKVEQLEIKLNNLSLAIDSFKSLTDEEQYETMYFVILSNQNKDKLEQDTDSIFGTLDGLGHLPDILEKKGIIAFLNSYYVKNAIKRDNTKELVDALPTKVEFKSNKYIETIKVGDVETKRYCKIISISDLPQWAYRGWMSRLINNNMGSVIIKSSDFPMGRAIEIVNKKLKVAEDNLSLAKDNLSKLSAEKEVLSLQHVLSDLSDGITLQKLNIFFVIIEKSPEKLNKASKTIIKELRAQGGFRVDRLAFLQKEAFHAIHPTDKDEFTRKFHHTLPVYAIQEGYPCTTDKYQDAGAPILATTFESVPVMIDFKKRNNKIVNSNIGIFGKSGSGKSFFSKKVLKDLISQGVKCFVIDPEQEYNLITQTFRGATIDLGGRAGKFINPLQFFGTKESKASEYALHISGVQSLLKGAAGLTAEEEGELSRLLSGLYHKFKITYNNAFKVAPNKWPIIEDLVKYTLKVAKKESKENSWVAPTLQTLHTKLDRVLHNQLKAILWNNYTNIVIEDAPIVTFDLKDLLNIEDKSILQTQMKSALAFINKAVNENKDKYSKPIDDLALELAESEKELAVALKTLAKSKTKKDAKSKTQNKDIKKLTKEVEDIKRAKASAELAWERKWVAVLVDEAHLLLDSDNPEGAKFLYSMVKRIRKYHGITITITQNIKDFIADEKIKKHTEGILNNQQYRFVFSLSSRDIDDFNELVSNDGGLTNTEKEVISTAGRGQSIAFIGGQRLIMSTFTTPDERMLINGDT